MLLAIDTAWSACSVALAEGGGGIKASRHKEQRRGQAETLVPMIGEVLADAKSDAKAINKILVTAGPGTFAGVRVGIAAARTLMLASGAKALGLTSFEALAGTLIATGKAGPGDAILALVPGKRGEVSAAILDGAACRTVKKPETIKTENLARWAGTTPVIAAGPDLDALLLESGLVPKASFSLWPSAENMIAALPVFKAKKFSGNLSPFYLRPADAKPQKPAFS